MGRWAREANQILSHLVTQTLLVEIEPGVHWELATHLKDRFTQSDQVPSMSESLVTDQPTTHQPNLVTPKLTKLTKYQRRILNLCEAPRSQTDLMNVFGLSHRTFFKRNHLDPLIKANLIRMTCPDEPNHPNQTYVVTEDGLNFIASWEHKELSLVSDQVAHRALNLITAQVKGNEDSDVKA